MTASLQQSDKRCGRPQVDVSKHFWLALYGAAKVRPLKNMIRRNATVHGGGRPQRVLVARAKSCEGALQ